MICVDPRIATVFIITKLTKYRNHVDAWFDIIIICFSSMTLLVWPTCRKNPPGFKHFCLQGQYSLFKLSSFDTSVRCLCVCVCTPVCFATCSVYLSPLNAFVLLQGCDDCISVWVCWWKQTGPTSGPVCISLCWWIGCSHVRGMVQYGMNPRPCCHALIEKLCK